GVLGLAVDHELTLPAVGRGGARDRRTGSVDLRGQRRRLGAVAGVVADAHRLRRCLRATRAGANAGAQQEAGLGRVRQTRTGIRRETGNHEVLALPACRRCGAADGRLGRVNVLGLCPRPIAVVLTTAGVLGRTTATAPRVLGCATTTAWIFGCATAPTVGVLGTATATIVGGLGTASTTTVTTARLGRAAPSAPTRLLFARSGDSVARSALQAPPPRPPRGARARPQPRSLRRGRAVRARRSSEVRPAARAARADTTAQPLLGRRWPVRRSRAAARSAPKHAAEAER